MTNDTPPASPAEPVYTIAHDGFTGTLQGRYVTREGKRGVIRHYADLLARVARERDALQASLDAMHGRPFSERVYAALKSRAETAEQRAEAAEKERDYYEERMNLYLSERNELAQRAEEADDLRNFYAAVERTIANAALERAAEACEHVMSRANHAMKHADLDNHRTERCHQEGRWLAANDLAEEIRAMKEPGHE